MGLGLALLVNTYWILSGLELFFSDLEHIAWDTSVIML